MPATLDRKSEIRAEALSRAVGGLSLANYDTIIRGFMAKGISADAITPRENVFTYNAWLALGRQVRKGEHGVKCITFIPMEPSKSEIESAQRDGRKVSGKARPRSVTVFHVSQTDPIGQ